MATVQQLEKLQHIQRVFHAGDSLESAVAGERVGRVIEKTEQIIRQRAFLRDERRRVRIAIEKLEANKKALELMKRKDFIPPDCFEESTPQKHIKINIGGLMFEVVDHILQRDPKSLLAELCNETPPVEPTSDGFFFFDRDWWLFRYILAFLRDGTLPDDRHLLAQLYRETSFWKLEQMQHAIEENKLHLRVLDEKEKEKEKDIWWRQLPSWWKDIEETEKKKKAQEEQKKKEEEDKKAKGDWWTGTYYAKTGKTFLPLPADPVPPAPAPAPAKATGVNPLSSTWSLGRGDDGPDYGGGHGYGNTHSVGPTSLYQTSGSLSRSQAARANWDSALGSLRSAKAGGAAAGDGGGKAAAGGAAAGAGEGGR